MRTAIVQAPYPDGVKMRPSDTAEWILCKAEEIHGADLAVLPEYGNCPGDIRSRAELEGAMDNNERFLERIKRAAQKNCFNIAVNLVLRREVGIFNTILLVGRDGKTLAAYDKAHLTSFERNTLGLSAGNGTKVVEVDGIHYGFMTCFDIYFSEYAEKLGENFPDIVIHPSYQRSEPAKILRAMAAGRALDLNAYIVRASYSMCIGAITGGHSMVCDPFGCILLDAGQKTGVFYYEIDIGKKRLRPECYGGDITGGREIIEKYRRPELYRNR